MPKFLKSHLHIMVWSVCVRVLYTLIVAACTRARTKHMLPVTKISKIIMNRLGEKCASAGEAAGIYGRTWKKTNLKLKISFFTSTSTHRSRVVKSSKNHKINTINSISLIEFQTKVFYSNPFVIGHNHIGRLVKHIQYVLCKINKQINCSRNNTNKKPEKFLAFANCIAHTPHTIQYAKASLIFVNVQLVIRFSGWNFRMPSTRTLAENRWPLSLNSGYMEVIKIGLNNYQLAVYLIRCFS